jgi:hypothetical protein
MRRRDFIQLASANLAGFGLGTLGMFALKLGAAPRPVTLHAQIGNLFPPLELVYRIRNSEHTKAQFVMLSESSRPELPGARDPRTIHLGLRTTELDPSEHQGNLQPNAQAVVMRRIRTVLEERFQCRVVQTTLDPSPAFWYPYLSTPAANLVFCRLVVKDALVADPA